AVSEEKIELSKIRPVVEVSKKAAKLFYQRLESDMQKINKTNNTYLGMAFLFLSLAITPFSLKAVGISPILFAGLDAWRQISSVFGDNHQPVTSSELLALNNINSGEDTGADREIGIQQFMAAQLQAES